MEMTIVVDRETLLHYGVTVVLLMVKVLVVSVASGAYKLAARVPTAPEDVRFMGGDRKNARFGIGVPGTERCYAALRNDFEQVYPFVIVSGLLVVLDDSTLLGQPIWVFFYAYAAARWAHTLCFLLALAPWRSVAFGTGLTIYVTFIIKLASILLSLITKS